MWRSATAMRSGGRTRLIPALLLIATVLMAGGRARAVDGAVGPADWPTYGHDVHHSFVGATTLTTTSARTLVPKWFFQTGDAVTANPVVVGSTVYVGSWDGHFYAIDAVSGTQRWRFDLDKQPAVSPPADSDPVTRAQNVMSDGGIVTSSAFYLAGDGTRPNLLLFGGGFTLYALRADAVLAAGAPRLFWKQDYSGLPEHPADPAKDPTRIFTSPVVVGDEVLFGVTADGAPGYRGYVAGASLADGHQLWRFETDVDTAGAILNDGCGGVWSSSTVDEDDHLMFFGLADCRFLGTAPYNERLVALHLADPDQTAHPDGSLAWVFTPHDLADGPGPDCDYDIGATANYGRLTSGKPFLGIGRKNGTYYSLDPATGKEIWERNVVFGGEAGGFLASTAFDGSHVFGATSLGAFPAQVALGVGPGVPPDTSCGFLNPGANGVQEPTMHALDATTGAVLWQGEASASFGPTLVAGGMTFVASSFLHHIQVRDAADGTLLTVLPIPSDCASGVTVSGSTIFFGTGSPEQGAPDGVFAYAPAGS